MGCDWYNDSSEPEILELTYRAVNENGDLADEETLVLRVPANGRVYVEQAADSEVKRR